MLPGPRSLPCRRYVLTPLIGNKEESMELTAYILYIPSDNTPLHSISSDHGDELACCYNQE